MAGINRAKAKSRTEKLIEDALEFMPQGKIATPCIFLSHSSSDKETVKKIASYIMQQGNIDIYFDINDTALQQADIDNNSEKVTEFIELGLSQCTHTMCIIGEHTSKSWWVPYELGFAKKSGKTLSSLKLKGDIYLPDYLKITEIIHGTKSLNGYLKNIVKSFNSLESLNLIEESLINFSQQHHPLDDYLDYNL